MRWTRTCSKKLAESTHFKGAQYSQRNSLAVLLRSASHDSKPFVNAKGSNTAIVGGLIASRQASEATHPHPPFTARLDWICGRTPSHHCRGPFHIPPTHFDRSAGCSGCRVRLVGQQAAKVSAAALVCGYNALDVAHYGRVVCFSMAHAICCSLAICLSRSCKVCVACCVPSVRQSG